MFEKFWIKLNIILIIVCFVLSVNSQTTMQELTKKEKNILQDAKEASQQGNLKKSNDLYTKLLSLKPQFTEAYLRLGSNYFQQKSYQQAEENFKKAIAIQPDFDPEMYYSLAVVEAEQKKYLAAADNLDIFMKNAKNKAEKVKKAEKWRDNLRFIDFATQHPVPFQPVMVSELINSENGEYSPSLSLNGKKMIFTRNIKREQDFIGQEDFYMADFDGESWSQVYPVSELNTYQNEGAFALSANGKYIVFTACDRRDAFGSCDLYYSMYLDSSWTKPVNMGHKVNSAAWDSQPTLSADGRTLIFASKRLGTIGGSDIFMTYRDDKNAWVKPINMGNVINSEGDDESPFLHPDGSTLYFRSNGRAGMGKFDIYYTKKNDTTDLWQTPINIGFPINTEGDEGSLTVSLDGSKAYFAAEAPSKNNTKLKQLDIFVFDLYDEARPKSTTFVDGYVTDASSGKAVKANITIKDLISGKVIFQQASDEKGYFISGITVGKNYACIVESKLYTYYAQNFDLSEKTKLYEPFHLDIRLQPLTKPSTSKSYTPIVLQNIFFDSGSAALLPASDHEIQLIAAMMQENLDISIKITGHTDDVGGDQANLTLSDQRAKSVASAIIAKGIDADRVFAEGKGETMPVADNNTQEGRQKNRRTEMQILWSK